MLKEINFPSWFRTFLAFFLILIIGLIFNAQGSFFIFSTHLDMLRQVSVSGILAVGMALVIVTGGIDLSVGSILAFSGIIFSWLSIHHDVSFLLALTICLLLGTLVGCISAFLISKFKLQPFMATLSMMVLIRGMAKWGSGGQKISTAIQNIDGTFSYKELPWSFNFLDQKILNNSLSMPTVLFLICSFLTWIILHKTYFGKHMLAVGGNENAARLTGVNINKTKFMAYGWCALMATVAGISQAAQEGQGDPESGVGYELTAIAMVVMGGTSLSGGKGSIISTLFGVLTIGYLEKILSLNAVSESFRLMLTGVIIICAVLLQKKGS